MTTNSSARTFLSERVWPVVRVALLQLLLMINILGNLAAWGVFVLVVDKLHWLQIDYRGKTINEVSLDGRILALGVVFLVNLLLVLLAWHLLERKCPRDMWWGFHAGWGQSLLWGVLVGLGEVLLVFGGMVALGLVEVTWGWHPTGARVVMLAAWWAIVSSVIGPIAEEVLHRGYWFQNVSRGWGIVVATLASAALFGGVHLMNPDAEWLGAVNIALLSVTFVLGMLMTRSLWFPIGWHAAWNFAQFFVAGLPNSGISVADMELGGTTLLVSQPSGPDLLTGGGFGMEASLVNTVVLVAAIGLMAWLRRWQETKYDIE